MLQPEFTAAHKIYGEYGAQLTTAGSHKSGAQACLPTPLTVLPGGAPRAAILVRAALSAGKRFKRDKETHIRRVTGSLRSHDLAKVKSSLLSLSM